MKHRNSFCAFKRNHKTPNMTRNKKRFYCFFLRTNFHLSVNDPGLILVFLSYTSLLLRAALYSCVRNLVHVNLTSCSIHKLIRRSRWKCPAWERACKEIWALDSVTKHRRLAALLLISRTADLCPHTLFILMVMEVTTKSVFRMLECHTIVKPKLLYRWLV